MTKTSKRILILLVLGIALFIFVIANMDDWFGRKLGEYTHPTYVYTYSEEYHRQKISERTQEIFEEELSSGEYLAFQSGINVGADFVMMGHIVLPEIDSLPASLSYKIINDELKGKLQFDGIIITDSLAMGAVSNLYTADELAVMAIKAGNDILLMPADLKLAVDGIRKAVESGEINEERINESVRKIIEVKSKRLKIY